MLIVWRLNIMRFGSMSVKPNKKPQIPFRNWQILTGDQVQIRSGRDRGKIGKVLKVYRKGNTVLVQGANLRTKRFKSDQQQLITQKKPSRIHVSNVGLYDKVAKRAVRIKYGYHPQTFQKLRISKKTGIIIQKPSVSHLTRENRSKNKKRGVKDTPTNLVNKITYQGEDFEQVKKQFQAFIAEKERKEKNLVFSS